MGNVIESGNISPFSCPFCGYNGSLDLMGADRFPVLRTLQVIGAGRRAARCPKCKSSDKERLVYTYLKEVEKIEKAIKAIREVNKEVTIMVDNCYGEFVQDREPIEIGADIAVGSLMKNLGGGIATSGAYIVGKKELIELCAERLTAPGIGKEIGPSLNQNTALLKGLFFAPEVVKSSVKTAIFASCILEELGFKVEPRYDEKRADIVQTIELGSKEKLVKFCQGIQKGSPIDSNVIPEPSPMGGYEDEVIMAAGTFTEGSTIELSCDGPIREPYIAYMQGGLTYEYGKYGVIKGIEEGLKE